MPERRRRDAGARVGEPGRLEQRLDRAVLAERPVEGDRPRPAPGRVAASRSRAAPTRHGPVGAERGRVVVGGRGPVRRADGRPGSHHQPPSRSMSDLARRRARASARASAMAVPDTIDTSCSADGPPSRTTIGGRPRRSRGPGLVASLMASPPRPAGPVAEELDLEAPASTPWRSARPRRGRASPSRRTSAAVPFWSLTMKLACFSETTAPPIRVALEAGLVDEPPGRDRRPGCGRRCRPTAARAAGAPGASGGCRRGAP